MSGAGLGTRRENPEMFPEEEDDVGVVGVVASSSIVFLFPVEIK